MLYLFSVSEFQKRDKIRAAYLVSSWLPKAFSGLQGFWSLGHCVGLDVWRGQVHFGQDTGLPLHVILPQVLLARDLPWSQQIGNELDPNVKASAFFSPCYAAAPLKFGRLSRESPTDTVQMQSVSQKVWGGAWGPPLTRFQVARMLLVHGPHSE